MAMESNTNNPYSMKQDMWNPLANELGIPWRAAEAMHWKLGEEELASRAGTVPFMIAPTSNTGVVNPSNYAYANLYSARYEQIHSAAELPPQPPPTGAQPRRSESLGEGPDSAGMQRMRRPSDDRRVLSPTAAPLLPSVAELERGVLAYDNGGVYDPCRNR
jgi:hypothetical protein